MAQDSEYRDFISYWCCTNCSHRICELPQAVVTNYNYINKVAGTYIRMSPPLLPSAAVLSDEDAIEVTNPPYFVHGNHTAWCEWTKKVICGGCSSEIGTFHYPYDTGAENVANALGTNFSDQGERYGILLNRGSSVAMRIWCISRSCYS